MTNAGKKFETNMGHIVRKHVPEEKMEAVFEWIRDGKANERVVVYVDFKVRVEPQRFEESSRCNVVRCNTLLMQGCPFTDLLHFTDPIRRVTRNICNACSSTAKTM